MDNTADYLKRRAYDDLLAWKNDLSDKTALLIEGARRVGKTSLIRRFVEKEYESFIYIDFSEKGRAVRAYRNAFAQCENVADLLQRFLVLSGVALIPGI